MVHCPIASLIAVPKPLWLRLTVAAANAPAATPPTTVGGATPTGLPTLRNTRTALSGSGATR